MYNAGGDLIDPNGTVCGGTNSSGTDVGQWDTLVNEIRSHCEDFASRWGLVLWGDLVSGISDWTKGVGVPKRLTNEIEFYVSHIEDFHIVLDDVLFGNLGWAIPTFTAHAIIGGDVNRNVFVNEVREYVDKAYAIPLGATVWEGGTEIGS